MYLLQYTKYLFLVGTSATVQLERFKLLFHLYVVANVTEFIIKEELLSPSFLLVLVFVTFLDFMNLLLRLWDMHVFSLVKIINNFITKLKSELTFKIFINIFVIYLCTNKFQNEHGRECGSVEICKINRHAVVPFQLKLTHIL
jgi:hypothetical protein